MTTLRSSSFLRLFVLPFVLSFWVSACSSSSWRPIEASPLTADAVADADSLRVITADSQQVILYPEITLLADTLVGRVRVAVKQRGQTIVERTRTAMPLDSVQSVEMIPVSRTNWGTAAIIVVAVGLTLWAVSNIEFPDWGNWGTRSD